MTHTIRQKDRLMARVRRIRRQLELLERTLREKAPRAEIIRQLAGVRGDINGLTTKVIDDHLRENVLAAESEANRRDAGEEMIEIIRTYMK